MASSWERLASVTLGSGGDTIDTGTITAKKYLEVTIDLASSGTQNRPCLRFNSDTGSNYGDRYSNGGGADGTGTSRSCIRAFGYNDASKTKYAVVNIINVADKEKLTIQNSMDNGGDGASNIPARDEGIGKWSNTSNAITSIQVFNDESGDFASGSIVTVWGTDDAAPFYPNTPNGTIFEESDTGKHYMFDGSSTWNEMV